MLWMWVHQHSYCGLSKRHIVSYERVSERWPNAAAVWTLRDRLCAICFFLACAPQKLKSRERLMYHTQKARESSPPQKAATVDFLGAAPESRV